MIFSALIAVGMDRTCVEDMEQAVVRSKSSKCQICGGPAFTKNFGAKACRACAAFFRRAVTGRRQYRCKALKACGKDDFQDFRKFPSCKSCRFQRCLQKGMNVEGIKAAMALPSAVPAANDCLMDRVVSFRSSLFLRRIKHLTDIGARPMRFQMATGESMEHVGCAEMRLLRDFLGYFTELWPYLKPDVTVEVLSTHFFAIWNMLELTLTTMRARGYLSNVIYFNDESYHPARDEAAEQLIASRWYNGPNLPLLARECVESWRHHMQFAFQIQKFQLDEAQLAALVQLLFARYEAEFFCDTASHSEFGNSALKGLYQYYKNVTRFTAAVDQITSVISEFQVVFNHCSEMMILVDLHVGDRQISDDDFASLQSYRCRSQFVNTPPSE